MVLLWFAGLNSSADLHSNLLLTVSLSALCKESVEELLWKHYAKYLIGPLCGVLFQLSDGISKVLILSLKRTTRYV